MQFLFPLIIKKVSEDTSRDTLIEWWGKAVKKLLTDNAWSEDAKRRFPQAMDDYVEKIDKMTMKECKANLFTEPSSGSMASTQHFFKDMFLVTWHVSFQSKCELSAISLSGLHCSLLCGSCFSSSQLRNGSETS